MFMNMPFVLHTRCSFLTERGDFNRATLGQTNRGAIGADFGWSIGRSSRITSAIIGSMMISGKIEQSMYRVEQGCDGQLFHSAPNIFRKSSSKSMQGTCYQRPTQPSLPKSMGPTFWRNFTNAVIVGRDSQLQNIAHRQRDGIWQMINP